MSLEALLKPRDSASTSVFVGSRMLTSPEVPIVPEGRTLVLEPDPDRAEQLVATMAGRAGFEVIAASLTTTEQAGPAQLRRYNFADLNGFADPAGLRGYFPGLRETGMVETLRMSPAELAARLPKDHGGGDVLVIDLLGEEMDVLRALPQASQFVRFHKIILRCTRESILAKGVNSGSIGEWLMHRGFDRMLQIDSSDPDFPVLLFLRNPGHGRMKTLEDQLAQKDRTLAERDQQLAEQKKAQEALQARAARAEAEAKAAAAKAEEATRAGAGRAEEARKAAKAEAETALKAARAEAETAAQAEHTALKAELERMQAALTRMKAEAESARDNAAQAERNRKAETEAQITAANRAAQSKARETELETALGSAQARIAGVEKTLAERDARIADLQKKAEEAQTAARTETRGLRDEAERMRRDLAVAIRMQSLRSTDLKDLQTQYAELLQQKADQDDLLQKLTVRLGSAAQYLRQMEDLPRQAPAAPEVTAEPEPEAPPAKAPARRRGTTSRAASGTTSRKASGTTSRAASGTTSRKTAASGTTTRAASGTTSGATTRRRSATAKTPGPEPEAATADTPPAARTTARRGSRAAPAATATTGRRRSSTAAAETTPAATPAAPATSGKAPPKSSAKPAAKSATKGTAAKAPAKSAAKGKSGGSKKKRKSGEA